MQCEPNVHEGLGSAESQRATVAQLASSKAESTSQFHHLETLTGIARWFFLAYGK